MLRPTWHFVAAEDLRWILAATSTKVEQGLARRYRQFELDERLIDRGLSRLTKLLDGKTFYTRRQLVPLMHGSGIAVDGQLGHLLMIAELRGLICSGPLIDGQHSYALLDEWIPAAPELPTAPAVAALVHRFFAGHGPASVTDLTRWAALTKTPIRAAIGALGDRLDQIQVDGHQLWFDPAVRTRTSRTLPALLLPVFDEPTLTYSELNFPRIAGHPMAALPGNTTASADLASGAVLVDGLNVGSYTRTIRARAVEVRIRFASSADEEQREWAEQGAAAIGIFHSRPTVVTVSDH